MEPDSSNGGWKNRDFSPKNCVVKSISNASILTWMLISEIKLLFYIEKQLEKKGLFSS